VPPSANGREGAGRFPGGGLKLEADFIEANLEAKAGKKEAQIGLGEDGAAGGFSGVHGDLVPRD
jgi:hypothetical protein